MIRRLIFGVLVVVLFLVCMLLLLIVLAQFIDPRSIVGM